MSFLAAVIDAIAADETAVDVSAFRALLRD